MTPEDKLKRLGHDDRRPTEDEWLQFRARARRSVTARRIGAAVGGIGLVAAVAIGAYALTSSPSGGRRAPDIAGPPTASSVDPENTEGAVAPDETGSVWLQQWFVLDEELQVFHVDVDQTETPARAAIARLIAGVPWPYDEDGVRSAIPEGTTLKDIAIEDRIAIVTFEGDFPDESGPEQDLALGQIVYTLTQFDTVEKVAMAWESAESGGTALGPEGRSKYDDYLPPIVVESPYAGETVGRTFELTGIANVFEATVSYRLVEEDGNVAHEGFTTALCGSGCWGTFQDKVTYKGDEPWVELQVFESSAEDGSPLHMVTVPISFER